MIPLRDLNPSRTTPVLTWALIAINVLCFLFELSLGTGGMHELIERFGVVPDALTSGDSPGSYVTPLTSMFLHGGFLHLIGNMWFLYLFGDNIEDNFGRVRFIIFYLACGGAAAAMQVAIDPHAEIPMVGASGAIAGVLGAYMTLYPRARVVTLVPIFIFLQFIELPAVFFIAVWFLWQLLSGLTSLGMASLNQGGVAFFAHVGGFVAGLALVWLFRRTPNETHGWRGPPNVRIPRENSY